MNILKTKIFDKFKPCIPIWFMRQAGRYLPEFRKIRSKNPNFIKLCLNSNLSSKITLQPIKRFNLDAAIIFSDILMIPYGLGQEVKFIKDKGPVLSNFNLDKFLDNNKYDFVKKMLPVYQAIRKTRRNLNKKKSLISFVGAPWTLMIYMLKLKKRNNTINLKLLEEKKLEINIIFNKLNDYLKIHIENQYKAGADVVQIFDSWAGLIPKKYLNYYCYMPNKKLVEFCKKINLPVICFPKGIKKNYLEFLKIVKPNGLNIDYDVNPLWAKTNLKNVCLQGGMNPKILLKGKKKIFNEVDKYLRIFKKEPYIFNLGHGLLPKTDPNILKDVIYRVNSFK